MPTPQMAASSYRALIRTGTTELIGWQKGDRLCGEGELAIAGVRKTSRKTMYIAQKVMNHLVDWRVVSHSPVVTAGAHIEVK